MALGSHSAQGEDAIGDDIVDKILDSGNGDRGVSISQGINIDT